MHWGVGISAHPLLHDGVLGRIVFWRPCSFAMVTWVYPTPFRHIALWSNESGSRVNNMENGIESVKSRNGSLLRKRSEEV